MTIDTLDDWNARLSCCCRMPACPVPLKVCKSFSCNVTPLSFVNPDDTVWKRWRKKTVTRTGTGTEDYSDGTSGTSGYYHESKAYDSTIWSSEEYDVTFYASCLPERIITCDHGGGGTFTITTEYGATPDVSTFSGTLTSLTPAEAEALGATPPASPCIPWFKSVLVNAPYGDPPTTTTTLLSDPFFSAISPAYYFGPTNDISYTYELPQTFAEWVESIVAAANAQEIPEEGYLNECESFLNTGTPPETNDDPVSVAVGKAQYQWQIPSTFEGTYFKITWDEWFFPESGDPVALNTDLTEEWTGPGSGGQDDPSWLVGSPRTLDVPTTPGIVKTANLRFICRHDGPYGNKPQISGDTAP